TVNPRTLSITANTDSKTYGQTRTYGAGSTASSSTGLQNSESIGSVTITASGGTAANAAVGSYNLSPSVATGGTFNPNNYNISYHDGTLTVGRASLLVKANDASRVFGAPNPTFLATYSGFVNSENESVLTGSPSLPTPATPSSPLGPYTLTAPARDPPAAHYTLCFPTRTL